LISTSAGETLEEIPDTSAGAPAPVVELSEPLAVEPPEPPVPKGNWPFPELEPVPEPEDTGAAAVGQVACPTLAPRRRARTATSEAITAVCPLWFLMAVGGGGGAG